MSPPKKIILSDIKVSRMMAEKAVHDQDFRDLLSDVASTGQLQTRGKKLRAIDQTMTDFRKQIVDEAGLEAPKDVSGHELNLNTYLKQVTYSRMLVSKASAQGGQGAVVVSGKDGHEWEWVVSNQICLTGIANSHLPVGKSSVCRTLSFVYLTINAPVPGRPFSVSL